MEKEYFVTWCIRTARWPICVAVARLCIPPHEEPKGGSLNQLCAEDVANQHGLDPDSVDVYSATELPAAPWCIGHIREVVVGGRAATLEAGAGGWRLHL